MVSNTIIASLLIIVIVISAVGLVVQQQPQVVKLSGRNTDTSTASATVSSTVVLNWTTSTIAWGTGNVEAGRAFCTLNTTNGSALNCTSFSAVSAPLVVENTGNSDVKFTLSSSKNASSLIQGTSPVFQWQLNDSESGSCTGTLNFTSFTDVNTSAQPVCGDFNSADSTDTIKLHLFARIPSDSTSGAKSSTITITGTAI